MIVRLQDNPKIIVKPEYNPITVTGATFYNFVGSGATTLTQTQTGNLVNVNFYTALGSAEWGAITGDINTQTDLTDYVSLSISAATSGLTSSWNEITDKPQWLSGTTLSDFQTGHTHSYNNLTDLPTLFDGDYDSLTNKPDLSVYLTGVTFADISGAVSGNTNLQAALDLKVDNSVYQSDMLIIGGEIDNNYNAFTAHTGNSLIHFEQTDISYNNLQDLPTLFSGDYDDLSNKPNLSLYQPVSGMSAYLTGVTWNQVTDKPELFTGHTFTASGITQISQVGDNVNIYVPADSITGVTFSMITGAVSGNTNLQQALDLKLDNTVYQADMLIISNEIDSNTAAITGKTDTTVFNSYTGDTQTALDAKASKYAGLWLANNNLQVTDGFNNYIIETNGTFNLTFDDSAGSLDDGFRCWIYNIGTGTISLVAGAGAVMRGNTGITTQYDMVEVYYNSTGRIFSVSPVTVDTSGFLSTTDFNTYTGATAPYLVVSGFTASGGTQLDLTSGNLTIYSPTGGTAPAWGSITGTLSGQTDLQTALDLKLDNSVYQSDMLIISGEIDALVTGVTANTASILTKASQTDFSTHTGNTAIHFEMSAITGFTSSNTFNTYTGDTQTALDGKSDTGHTHSYTGGTITDLPTLFSGSYDDLTDKPDLGSIASKDYWTGTQAQYDALGTYDSNTLYFITA